VLSSGGLRTAAIASLLAVEVVIAALIVAGYGFLVIVALLVGLALVLALQWPAERVVLVYLAILALSPDVLQVAVGGFALTAGRALAAVMAAVFALRLLIGGESRRRSPIDVPIAAFALALAVSYAATWLGGDLTAMRYGFSRLVAFGLEFFCVYYIVYWSVRSARARKHVVYLFVYVMAVVAVYGLVEAVTGRNVLNSFDTSFGRSEVVRSMFTRADLTRARATFEHPISLGTALAMTLPLGLFLTGFAGNRGRRIVAMVCVALVAACLVATLSRGAYVAGALGLLVLFAFSGGSAVRARVAVIASAAVVLGLTFGGSLLGRISQTFTLDASIGTRIADYPYVWAVFLEHPFIGKGLGTLNPLSFRYIDNYFLKTIGEMGAIGALTLAALFVWILAVLTMALRRLEPGEGPGLRAAVLAALIVFMVQTATFDSFSFSKPSSLFWVLVAVGMSIAVDRRDRSSGSAESATALPGDDDLGAGTAPGRSSAGSG
jgi:hypothetical protein